MISFFSGHTAASEEVPSFILTPLVRTFQADTETPVSVYLKLQRPYSCLLESVEGEELLARFSYIAVDPVAVLKGTVDGPVSLEIRDERFSALARIVEEEKDLRRIVDRCMAMFSSTGMPRSKNGAMQMTTSGMFGYFGYDTLHLVEKIPSPEKPDPAGLPDMCLLFCDTLVIFDNVMRKLFLVANYLDENDRQRAEARIEELAALMFEPLDRDLVQLCPETPEPVVSNTSRDEYYEKVRKAKEYILSGDIFQVQISQRLQRKLHTRPFDVYRVLRTINPSPYLYFYDFEDFYVVGSSPELLVKVECDTAGRRIVDTRPIAGTRRRGETFDEDERNAEELLSDEKECAEHLMLIDLSRNDIGRIAKIGTVETNEMMVIEKYSHVMHIVSNVRGELQDGLSAMDAFWSCFPAGTLTGAPKVRSMEIIYELEKEKRGLYGGAVGYLDFRGGLTTAIAIRTMVIRDGIIYFQAAGGIVADSTPEFEYEETMNKMRAGLTALESIETSSD
jgi:anthranilate synthase component 1